MENPRDRVDPDAERVRALLVRASDGIVPADYDPAASVQRRSGRRRRRARVALSGVVVVAVSLAVLVPLALWSSAPPSVHPVTSEPLPPLLWRELWNLSQQLAAGDGDPHANDRQAVGPVSRALAVRLTSGDLVGGDTTPSYVIEIKGNFTCRVCSSPAPGHAPSGRVIVDVLDAFTLFGSDFGLSARWVPLNRLGNPILLPRPPHGTLWPMPPSHVSNFSGTWSAAREGAVMTLRGTSGRSTLRWVRPRPKGSAAFIAFGLDEARTGPGLPAAEGGTVTANNVGLPADAEIVVSAVGDELVISTSPSPKTPIPGPFCRTTRPATACP